MIPELHSAADSFNILAIEDNPADLYLVEEMLRSTPLPINHLYAAERVDEARSILQKFNIHLVLLDLNLPDSSGINTFLSFEHLASKVPVIILTGLSDSQVAMEAIKKGAQDYLVKGEFTGNLLFKSIQYSLERERNIKELMESNERFHALANATHDAIWDWNIKSNTVWRNENLNLLFGYDSNAVDPKLNFWYDHIHPEDKEEVIRSITGAIDEKKINWSGEYRFLKADGSYAYVYDRACTLFDENGVPYRMVGCMTDITAAKEAGHALLKNAEVLEKKVQERTRELQEANEHLKRSNAELEQFAYVASHDLQEPLRKILMFSQRLQLNSGQLSAAGSGMLEKIQDAARRMSELIKDLLDYSRLTKDNSQQLFESVNLDTVLHHVLNDMEVAIHQKNAIVEAEELPVIDAIEVQMNQLLHNMISNSLKFTVPGRVPRLRITNGSVTPAELMQYQLPAGKEYHKLIFSDNGIGFEQEFAEQIFVVFQRLHSREEYPGTGIGLALCQRVVETHHGHIRAEGKPGEGATFIILLPKEQEQKQEAISNGQE